MICMISISNYFIYETDIDMNINGCWYYPSDWLIYVSNVYIFQAVGPFEVFNKCPTIKFKLSWSKSPTDDCVDPPPPITDTKDCISKNHMNHHIDDKQVGK